MGYRPTVSIVVPTFNRASILRDCVESLITQSYEPSLFEVIVIDDGSDDNTSLVMREFTKGSHNLPNVVYRRQPHTGRSAARNLGISCALGEVVWLVDSDEVAPRHILGEYVAALHKHTWATGVGGGYITEVTGKHPSCVCASCVVQFKSWSIDGRCAGEVDELPGGNAAIRKRLFDEVGGFAQDLEYGEDFEWFARARANGARFLYLPTCTVKHVTPSTDLKPSVLLRTEASKNRARSYALARRKAGWNGGLGPDVAQAVRFLGHALRRHCLLGLARGIGRTRLALLWKRERRALEVTSARQVSRPDCRA